MSNVSIVRRSYEAFSRGDMDAVVALGRYRGVARRTGRRLDVPFVHVWSLRDGRVWRFRQFLDTHDWVEALEA